MLTAVCFAGCQQEDIVYPEPDAKVAETYLTLNELTQSPLQVPGPEGTYILKVISDDKRTLSAAYQKQKGSNIPKCLFRILRIHGMNLVRQN